MKTAVSWGVVVLLLLAAPPNRASAGPSGYERVATFPLGGPGGWDYLTLDSANRRLFIARENRANRLLCQTSCGNDLRI